MASASVSKSRSSRREATLDARQRQLKALARRPARVAGRRSARWEILGIFVLGLGLVAFPWGRVGAALNGTQERPERIAAAPEAAAARTGTLADGSCAVVAVSTGTDHRAAAANPGPCPPER